MTPATAVAGGLAAVVFGAGAALGATGTIDLVSDATPPGPLAPHEVPYHACPDTGEVGTLVRGDRVLAVGRDADSRWLQLRRPDDLFDRVWVAAEHLDADDDVNSLPVVSCGGREVVTDDGVGEVAATTTTEPASTTTSSEPDDSTTTTSSTIEVPSTTAAPATTVATTTTTPPTTTTTTQPPANQPPQMGSVQRQHAVIFDTTGTASSCPSPGRPTTSDISVSVTDDRGVASVRMTARLGQNSADLDVSRNGSTYTATFGPVGNVQSDTVFTIDVVATDDDGATTSRSTNVTVRPCP